MTAHGQSKLLARLFLQHTFDGESERLGGAALAALRDYALLPEAERLLRACNVRGDPALRIPR